MACLNFEALRDLHDYTNDLLHSSIITKQALLIHERWIHEASEASLQLLDMCNTNREALSVMKHEFRDLQSALRRTSVGESITSVGNQIATHNLHKKKLKKHVLGCLKGMKRKHLHISATDHNLSVVIRVLMQVRETAITIMEILLTLIMSTPFQEKKWREKYNTFALQNANKKLEMMAIAIEDLETELECMFRRLIQTRVLLLNILTG